MIGMGTTEDRDESLPQGQTSFRGPSGIIPGGPFLFLRAVFCKSPEKLSH